MSVYHALIVNVHAIRKKNGSLSDSRFFYVP